MDPFILQYKQRIHELTEQLAELNETLEIYDEILEYVEPAFDQVLLEESEEGSEEELTEAKKDKKKWIQGAIEKEGALRKSMKTKKGNKIPEKKLEAAAKKGGKTGKRARLAKTLRAMAEKKDKKIVSEKEKAEKKK